MTIDELYLRKKNIKKKVFNWYEVRINRLPICKIEELVNLLGSIEVKDYPTSTDNIDDFLKTNIKPFLDENTYNNALSRPFGESLYSIIRKAIDGEILPKLPKRHKAKYNIDP